MRITAQGLWAEEVDLSGLRTTLAECCARGLPALIASLDPPATRAARFAALFEDGLELRSEDSPGGEVFPTPSLCLVMFYHRGQTKSFTAHVQGIGGDGKVLCLVMPERGMSLQGRRVYRTPLLREHVLDVTLTVGGEARCEVDPIDIGLGGVGVTLPKGAPPLFVGSEVVVELRLGMKYVCLAGEVRDRRGNRCGIAFSETLDEEHGIAPPPELHAIVAALLRDYLAHCARRQQSG